LELPPNLIDQLNDQLTETHLLEDSGALQLFIGGRAEKSISGNDANVIHTSVLMQLILTSHEILKVVDATTTQILIQEGCSIEGYSSRQHTHHGAGRHSTHSYN